VDVASNPATSEATCVGSGKLGTLHGKERYAGVTVGWRRHVKEITVKGRADIAAGKFTSCKDMQLAQAACAQLRVVSLSVRVCPCCVCQCSSHVAKRVPVQAQKDGPSELYPSCRRCMSLGELNKATGPQGTAALAGLSH
jgi:hypothetical protein